MSFIDASTASPLAALSNGAAAPEDETAETHRDDEAAEGEEAQLPAEDRKGTLVEWLLAQTEDINLARNLDNQTLNEIGMAVTREFGLDENSRADWLDKTEQAAKFAAQVTEAKQYPWPGASNVVYPLIAQAALQFNATTYPAVVQGRNVVKGTVWGSDRGTPATQDGKPDGQPVMQPGPDGKPQPVWLVAPGEKRQRADRIGEHMSYQLLQEMPEWEPQTDQLLLQIPIVGGAVRKTYRDPVLNRNRSLLVSLVNMVWDYHAPSFEAAPRHSEKVTLYPHEIVEMEQAGRESEDDEGAFLHLDYGPGDGGEATVRTLDGEPQTHDQSDPDAPHLFIEQHRRWDLDGDGYPEPYIVTVHFRSSKVVRIVARYDADGIKASEDGETIRRIDPDEHYTLIPFLPSIDGGSYPTGFGHLLRPLNEAINSTFNQMFDAGHLANAGGGFVSDQLGIASGQTLFQVGKFTRVNTKGQAIRDAVFPLPFPGPNAVLFQLLGTLMSAGKELASIQAVLTGDATIANAPPTTVLALIEQGLKVYTAIHKRIFRALGSEFDKLYKLNRKYIVEAETYTVGDEGREIHPDDYRLGGGVEPVADPTVVTDMQKLVRSQVVAKYLGNPLMRQDEIIRRELEAANVDRIDDLFAPPDPMQAITVQFAIAKEQAELGRLRAAEQKDSTQAFLNLALARAKATGPEEAAINAQMDFLRLHIEALNTSIKAAMVDHKFHDTGMRATAEHARIAADQAAAGPQAQPAPEPAPAGPFPTAPGPTFTPGPATATPSPEGVS